jgi:hypothetical protein
MSNLQFHNIKLSGDRKFLATLGKGLLKLYNLPDLAIDAAMALGEMAINKMRGQGATYGKVDPYEFIKQFKQDKEAVSDVYRQFKSRLQKEAGCVGNPKKEEDEEEKEATAKFHNIKQGTCGKPHTKEKKEEEEKESNLPFHSIKQSYSNPNGSLDEYKAEWDKFFGPGTPGEQTLVTDQEMMENFDNKIPPATVYQNKSKNSY